MNNSLESVKDKQPSSFFVSTFPPVDNCLLSYPRKRLLSSLGAFLMEEGQNDNNINTRP